MLFILIALIGSGWAFIKPFLAEREKKIFLIVIPLQILDNIAMIITEETAPGSQGWFTWVTLLLNHYYHNNFYSKIYFDWLI